MKNLVRLHVNRDFSAKPALSLKSGACLAAMICASALVLPPAQPVHASDYFEIQEKRFIIDVAPVAGLWSFNAEDFTLNGPYKQEKIKGAASFMPEFKLGLGLDADKILYDITACAGAVWNRAFHMPYAGLDAAALFKIGDHVGLGPHVKGIYAFMGDWKGDADADISGAPGGGGGIALTVGPSYSNWCIQLAVDYIYLVVKPKESQGWKANGDLDLSGISAQLGLVYRFGPPVMPPTPGYHRRPTPAPAPSTHPSP